MKIFFYVCASIFKINNNLAFKNDKISHFENVNHASNLKLDLFLQQKDVCFVYQ